MRALLPIASLAALCLGSASAQAGLIFEIDGIRAHHIDAAELGDDQLTVTSRGRSYTIRVPEGTGALLLAWARADTGGPLVFSIDGSLVSTGGDNYWPPSVPAGLGYLLFSYDDYAHHVACGATPSDQPRAHPLVQSAGEGTMPYRAHAALLDPATRSPQAYSYRRLPERFVRPLACIGELSLYATQGTGGRLVSIQPRSWVHMIGYQWYRGIDVPSEADKWVARLPYQALKQDMERRWTAYRSAFRALDSLSSMVEVMALLRAIRHDTPSVWTELNRKAPTQSVAPRKPEDGLDHHRLDTRAWERLTYAWIGDRIETPAEANLALGLASLGDAAMLTAEGLDAVAAQDPTISAKVQLARLVLDRDTEPSAQSFIEDSNRLFQTLSRISRSFRLRAVALSRIAGRARQLGLHGEDALAKLLWDQRDAIVGDFASRARAACDSSSNDLATWESLSQDVYSVGLLRYFKQDDGGLPAESVAAVACIHFRRGMAPQQGRELAFRHAHYRFLKYLGWQTDDSRTRSLILQYRRKLAETMNLHDSDLREQVQP